MSKLVKAYREKASKCKDPRMSSEAEASVGYSTGFLGLDYLNGTVIHVKSDTMNFKYNSIGIVDGCATTVIGRSGCGKTTLLTQIAGNIIRPYKTSAMFLDDIEGGSTPSRLKSLLKMSVEEMEQRLIYRNTGITAENIHDRIKMIRDEKIDNRMDYEYDTGLYDYKGDRIFKLEPTIYMIDSIPLILPEDMVDNEELGGSMSATAIAKTNTALFKRISQLAKEANIIVLSINHILDDVVINPRDRKKAQLSYLKPGERLPGGKAAIYLATNMMRVDDGTKLTSDEVFGIDGSIVEIQMLKSRTNKTGKVIPMVFDFERGFDPDLSLYQMLKAAGRINGSGVSYYVGSRNDIKFSQKNFKTKLHSDPELQKIFAEECYDYLCSLLSDPVYEDTEDNVSDMLLKMGTIELTNIA